MPIKLVYYIALLITLTCTSQVPVCPDNDHTEYYLNLFDVKDKNALVIKSGTNIGRADAITSFLILTNNDTIYQYGIFTANGKMLIKKHIVTKREKNKFISLLSEINTIDKTLLNITQNGSEDIYIPDGVTYDVHLFDKESKRTLSTYAPEAYIKNTYPGYKERKKLMDAVNALDFRGTIESQDIETIKKIDTIYFDTSEINLQSDSFRIGQETMVVEEVGSTKIISSTLDKFLHSKKNHVINLNFFLKYGSRVDFLKSKVVFTITQQPNHQLELNKVKMIILPKI